MILGSVASGMLVGLAAAMITWAGGHPLAAVILAYSVPGSLATLFVAGMTGLHAAQSGTRLR
jgi:uncharacterized protein (DUF2062 family)